MFQDFHPSQYPTLILPGFRQAYSMIIDVPVVNPAFSWFLLTGPDEPAASEPLGEIDDNTVRTGKTPAQARP